MEKKKTGPLSEEDKAATQALSEFYHWLGNSLKHLKTYEEGGALIDEADKRMSELEIQYPEIDTTF